jgi:hypothetical protein
MYEFLERIRFFAPSSALTEDIVEHNHTLATQELRADPASSEENLNEHLPSKDEAEHGEHAHLGRDFINKLYQTLSSDEHLERPHSPEELRRIHHQNRLIIAERLYGYLAILARRPQAMEGHRYHIGMVIVEEMGPLLGLSHLYDSQERLSDSRMPLDSSQPKSTAERLLWRLAEEFHKWLSVECRGHYEAPWGEMLLEKEHYLLLIAHTFHKPKQNRSYTRANYAPPLSDSYYSRKTRKA